MITSMVSRIVIIIFGTLYPAYASFKTVRSKSVRGYVEWMKYWIVYGFLSPLEPFCDFFLSPWMPFYYEAKILFVAWMVYPATRGYNFTYQAFIQPFLGEKEEFIDEFLTDVKDKSHEAVLQYGKKWSAAIIDSLIKAVLSRTGFAFAPHLQISPSTEHIPFFDESDNRAIEYHPQHTGTGTLVRTWLFTGNRRQSDPTHSRSGAKDPYNQDTSCIQLKRNRAVSSIESMQYMSDDELTMFSQNPHFSMNTEMLSSYQHTGDKIPMEKFDTRSHNAPQIKSAQLVSLVRKLSLEGLTEKDISVVVATLLADFEPNLVVSSDHTTATTPRNVSDGNKRSLDLANDIVSGALDTKPLKSTPKENFPTRDKRSLDLPTDIVSETTEIKPLKSLPKENAPIRDKRSLDLATDIVSETVDTKTLSPSKGNVSGGNDRSLDIVSETPEGKTLNTHEEQYDCSNPFYHDDDQDKTNSHCGNIINSNDAKHVSRAGRYRKRRAPSPPEVPKVNE